MKQILLDSKMTIEQQYLLFCLKKEIVEKDIEYSEQNEDKNIYEYKNVWFDEWKAIFARVLNKSILEINALNKSSLQGELKDISKSSKKKIYKQCMDFIPFKWESLIEIDEYISCHEPASPILKINSKIKNDTLKEIAVFLDYYKIRR